MYCESYSLPGRDALAMWVTHKNLEVAVHLEGVLKMVAGLPTRECMVGVSGVAPANPIVGGGPTGGFDALLAGGNRGPPGKAPEVNDGGPLLTKTLDALE